MLITLVKYADHVAEGITFGVASALGGWYVPHLFGYGFLGYGAGGIACLLVMLVGLNWLSPAIEKSVSFIVGTELRSGRRDRTWRGQVAELTAIAVPLIPLFIPGWHPASSPTQDTFIVVVGGFLSGMALVFGVLLLLRYALDQWRDRHPHPVRRGL